MVNGLADFESPPNRAWTADWSSVGIRRSLFVLDVTEQGITMSNEPRDIVWVQTAPGGKDFPIAGSSPVLKKLVILGTPRADYAQTLGEFRIQGRDITLRFTEPYAQILSKLDINGYARPPVKNEGKIAAFIDKLWY